MRMGVSLGCCLLACACGVAQAGTPVREDAPAVAQEYLVPPASLSPEQVGQLQQRLLDWPQLQRYRADNARLAPPQAGRVVFFGDSITQQWGQPGQGEGFFPGKPYLNRGIAGQTTAQMLVRMRQDVIDLHPQVVVILAGTNDIAGNTGPATLAMIQDNLQSMAELARAHGIGVVLASVLPASAYPWRPGTHPAARIRMLNAWISQYARRTGVVYLDYYHAMANAQGGLDPALAADGVHPTAAGYAIMAPLAQRAIDQALAASVPTSTPQ